MHGAGCPIWTAIAGIETLFCFFQKLLSLKLKYVVFLILTLKCETPPKIIARTADTNKN